jgi:hypothetical protein
MNLNIITYGIYGIVSYFITVHVGWLCYKHGIHYLKAEIKDDKIADTINKILLIGYYLVNLGYTMIKINNWPLITSFSTMIESLCLRIGVIVFTLGLLHVSNLLLIYILRKNRIT